MHVNINFIPFNNEKDIITYLVLLHYQFNEEGRLLILKFLIVKPDFLHDDFSSDSILIRIEMLARSFLSCMYVWYDM